MRCLLRTLGACVGWVAEQAVSCLCLFPGGPQYGLSRGTERIVLDYHKRACIMLELSPAGVALEYQDFMHRSRFLLVANDQRQG